MLKLEIPDYKYCPLCGKELERKREEGEIRKWCPKDNWTFYPRVACSGGIAAEKDGKFLLVKRNREPYKGKWMFPAGFVEYGENPAETAAREFQEETGYEVKDLKLIKFWQVEDDPRAPGHFAFFYHADVGEKVGEVTDKDENSEMGWFAPGEFPEIGWHGQRKMAEELAAKLLKNL